MLFIIVMDVLTNVVDKSEEMGLLQPLASRQIGNRMSIYADVMVLFAIPCDNDINIIETILESFGKASRLYITMSKSS